MAAFIVTDEELEALHELSWLAQLVYLRALRPHLDYETGLIGARRKISRRQIIEEVTVPAKRGRHSISQEAPTEKGVRFALETLCDAGVIVRTGPQEAMVFRAPKAYQQQSVSGMRGRRGADEGPGMSGLENPSPDIDLDDMRGRRGAGCDGSMRGPHLLSVVSSKNSTATAVLVAAAADDQKPGGGDKVVKIAKRPDGCPYTEIVGAYHEALPELATVKVLTDTRKALIRSRWKERPDMDYWRRFFAYVGKSKFLTGQVPPSRDRPPFAATLEWLMRPSNYAKVIEGNYHHDGEA